MMTLVDGHGQPSVKSRSVFATTWTVRLMVFYFTFAGVAVFVLWFSYLLDGTASVRLTEPVVEVGTLVGRTVGASFAGSAVLLAAWGAKRGRSWSVGVATVGAGSVGYAALNTLGETLATRSAMTALVGFALVAALAASWRLNRSVKRPDTSGIWLLLGLAGFAGWMVVRSLWLAGSSVFDTHDIVAWPVTHYLAETGMAVSAAVGLIVWIRGRRWGQPMALGGLGAYIYSTLNAIDWAVVNDRLLLPILAVTLAVALTSSAFLIASRPERT